MTIEINKYAILTYLQINCQLLAWYISDGD